MWRVMAEMTLLTAKETVQCMMIVGIYAMNAISINIDATYNPDHSYEF